MLCANPNCPDPEYDFDVNDSYRYGVGFSHYQLNTNTGEYERSYSQVFNTLHCCSVDCAKSVTHARIDSQASVPFGEYNRRIHNPTGEQSHQTCRDNVEYNQLGIMPDSALPKECALSGASLVGRDIYIPHVDKSYEGRALNTESAGCASLSLAQQLAHQLIDEN